MADFNKVMMIGRLTRDPQLKYTPSQTAICEFGLASGRKYRTASGEDREETCFVDCTLFGKGGEVFNQYMSKGKQVFIEGRLKFDSWEDKQGGGKRSKLTVVVENFQFLGAPGDGGGEGGGARRGGGGAGRSDDGGYGSGDYDSGRGDGGRGRGGPPQRGGRAAPAQQAEPPYGDEQHFEGDDDIPF